MPSENAGKEVIRVKKYKSGVHVTFNDSKTYNLTYDTYLNFNLYEGKKFTEKEYSRLLKDYRLSDLYLKCVKRCSRRLISEWDIRMYLKENYLLESDSINYIVNKLKDNSYIDDLKMAKYYQDYYNLKNYGEKTIKKKLLDKGIFKETIEKLDFNDSLELEKAYKEIEKVKERYLSYPEATFKQKVRSHLVQKGFNQSIVKEATNDLSYTFNDEAKEKLKKEFNHYYNMYLDKYSSYELKRRVNEALLRNGYKYEYIQKMWKEKE